MDWSHFLSAFGLVFLAELGDKTQLAVITQAGVTRRPWAVFWGATAALVVVTGLGVLLGDVLYHLVPEVVVRAAAVLAFAIMGGLILWRAFRNPKGSQDPIRGPEAAGSGGDAFGRLNGWDWKVFGSTLGLLFFAELGDKTQLAVLAMSSEHVGQWEVFGGGALALIVVTALGVLLGQQIVKLIPRRILLLVAGLGFVVMGGALAVEFLLPG